MRQRDIALREQFLDVLNAAARQSQRANRVRLLVQFGEQLFEALLVLLASESPTLESYQSDELIIGRAPTEPILLRIAGRSVFLETAFERNEVGSAGLARFRQTIRDDYRPLVANCLTFVVAAKTRMGQQLQIIDRRYDRLQNTLWYIDHSDLICAFLCTLQRYLAKSRTGRRILQLARFHHQWRRFLVL